jgi:hypothetical protein
MLHTIYLASKQLQQSHRLLVGARIVLYLVHDVLDLHPLGEEVHEFPFRIHQVQHDAVVHQVLGPREISDAGVEVLTVILQLSYGISKGVHGDEQRL